MFGAWKNKVAQSKLPNPAQALEFRRAEYVNNDGLHSLKFHEAMD